MRRKIIWVVEKVEKKPHGNLGNKHALGYRHTAKSKAKIRETRRRNALVRGFTF